MPRRASIRIAPSAVALAAAILLAGCGSTGSDGGAEVDAPTQDVPADAIRSSFETQAARAYDTLGLDRSTDYSNGARPPCFALDDEAVTAIAAAVGIEDPVDVGQAYLVGPPERELLTCTALLDGEAQFDVSVGTTDQDAGDLAAQLAGIEDPPEVLEGTAEGLDPEAVIAVRGGDRIQVGYVVDGVQIGLGASADLMSADQAFAALPVVVAEVSRTLGA